MTTEEGENCSKDTVFIHASYPFGKLAVETVDLMKNVPKTALGKTLKIKEKSGSPNNIIKTSTYLELATIELCIDAIDAGDFGEICLHRKIAPYQCYIYCLASGRSLFCPNKYIRERNSEVPTSILSVFFSN